MIRLLLALWLPMPIPVPDWGITDPAMAYETAVRLNPPAPPPVVVVPPAPTWVKYNCESFHYLYDKVGLPWYPFGTTYMPRESHCDPGAFYDGPNDLSYGLLQINTQGYLWSGYQGVQDLCGVTSRAQLFDPETNIRCAKALYDKYGLKPWRT